MSDELVERVRVALVAAAALVPELGLFTPRVGDGVDGARRTLDAAEAAIAAWTLSASDIGGRGRSALLELASARLLLHTYELDRRRNCVTTLQGCLHRMRGAASVQALAAQVPHDVASLGFGRAMFSWVDQARWVPVAYHTGSGPEEARAVMQAGSPPYWHTRDLLEAEMIRHRRSMLVHDALGNPHVHLDIQAVMQSRSYVAAPIVRGTCVIGFVHADQSVERGAVDEFDRDLLSTFAEGLGLALDQLSTHDELTRIRASARRQAATLQEVAADLGDLGAELDIAGATSAQTPVPTPVPTRVPQIVAGNPGWGAGLTRREEQVLELLAEGRSNGEIAQRLYITESTAKTHVKHVLRKVGASNRAQAGALRRGARAGG